MTEFKDEQVAAVKMVTGWVVIVFKAGNTFPSFFLGIDLTPPTCLVGFIFRQ